MGNDIIGEKKEVSSKKNIVWDERNSIQQFNLDDDTWLWVEELENGTYLVELHEKDDVETLRDSATLGKY